MKASNNEVTNPNMNNRNLNSSRAPNIISYGPSNVESQGIEYTSINPIQRSTLETPIITNGVSIQPPGTSSIRTNVVRTEFPRPFVVTSQPSESSTAPHRRGWSTGMFDCLKDEESCWWGMWCCWIVSARTTDSFGLGKSSYNVIFFWIFVVLLILFTAALGPLVGLIFGLLGGSLFAYQRAVYRSSIREKLGIDGSFSDDCVSEFFCSCCSVCQESREGKIVNVPEIDFCCGQPFSSIALLQDSSHDNDSFVDHLGTISQTSKLILILCGAVCLITIFVCVATKHPLNLAILLLIFVQPFVLLYFVYWKPRRKFALLDNVIKIFAVGFWFTTFQSVILESILQFFVMVFIGIAGGLTSDPSQTDDSSKSFLENGIGSLSFGELRRSSINVIYRVMFDMYYGSESRELQDGSSNDGLDQQRNEMRSHFVLVVIALFLMAFVVAAGVEETMKHFAVRCCKLPVALSEPHSILVYLMTAALGFATAENIEYVFSSGQSPIPGTSKYVGEIVVLLIRVLMPIHVICSVMQAANLSKVSLVYPYHIV